MNNKVKQIVTVSLAFFSIAVIAKENVVNPNATSVVNYKVAAGCNPSQSKTDLDVNNVRTLILGGGDMWWNLADAQYEIPKGGNKHSMFAQLIKDTLDEFINLHVKCFKNSAFQLKFA